MAQTKVLEVEVGKGGQMWVLFWRKDQQNLPVDECDIWQEGDSSHLLRTHCPGGWVPLGNRKSET